MGTHVKALVYTQMVPSITLKRFKKSEILAMGHLSTKGERIYQDYFGDFFLRVILRFISHLETILNTIFSENNC